MNFDISKLGAGQSKGGESKAKSRFGPAVRARPKLAAKPAEAAPAAPEPVVESRPSDNSGRKPHLDGALSKDVQAAEPASTSTAYNRLKTLQHTEEAVAAPAPEPEKEVHCTKPTAGKRKTAESAEVDPAHAPDTEGCAGNALALASTDSVPEAGGPDSGPMTKAKKRKGMANGTGKGSEPRQPKTPLAELKIDAQTMNMKTVIKCANAKDRAKSIAAQLAKDAAAIGQGSSEKQQGPSAPTPEPTSPGAPQMIVDPETGKLVLDKASLTLQAQPREEYVRREAGHHDLVNSQTYMRRGATNRWSPEETDEFWAGLAIFGNVPTMIAQRLNIRMAELGLPHIKRTNMHVKNKIKKEHKSNARRVEALIAHQHAEPEDYAEVREGLDAAQVQEEEYLEAAPSGEDGPAQLDAGPQTSDAPTSSSVPAEAQTALPKAEEQSGHCAGPASAKGPNLARARPRAAPRPRATRSAQQAAAKTDAQQQQQQQQQPAPDDGQNRYMRMMQEAGVTPEEMEEGL